MDESERRAMARELHDGPVQLLVAASLRLQSAAHCGELSPEVASTVSAQIDEAAAQLRALTARLLAGPGAGGLEEQRDG